ncbi:MAG: hypothetical protein M5U14_09245 [Acidimicrobiia bacterium]|nr:hypothetical protein [Acidimicrobiia bacterium]
MALVVNLIRNPDGVLAARYTRRRSRLGSLLSGLVSGTRSRTGAVEVAEVEP